MRILKIRIAIKIYHKTPRKIKQTHKIPMIKSNFTGWVGKDGMDKLVTGLRRNDDGDDDEIFASNYNINANKTL